MTNPYDQTEREYEATICPDCGEDLEWHSCVSDTRTRETDLAA
jgi:hypothetical protein